MFQYLCVIHYSQWASNVMKYKYPLILRFQPIRHCSCSLLWPERAQELICSMHAGSGLEGPSQAAGDGQTASNGLARFLFAVLPPPGAEASSKHAERGRVLPHGCVALL